MDSSDITREKELQTVTSAPPFEYKELAAELRAQIQGEVCFDSGSRALYATDSSNYRQIPIGVVLPREVDDVTKTIATCQRYHVPVLARGGGTSLAGQCCNTAVVIDMSRYMNKIIEIDPQKKLARVQPGVILDDLRRAAEQFHLTFGPDPSTHSYCTIGGMIGNDSCGTHSVMAGKTIDNVQQLEILTYNGLRMTVGQTDEEELERLIKDGGKRGEIYARLKSLRDQYADLIRERFPRLPRRVSGYPLDQLLPEHGFHVARALVGTENTCVTILEATVRLVDSPRARTLLVLSYADIYSAADDVVKIMAHKPIALEGMDRRLIENARRKNLLTSDIALLPPGGGWLLVEFGNDTMPESIDQAKKLMDELAEKEHAPGMKLFEHPHEAQRIWLIRETAVGATGSVPGEANVWPGWEDSAVPPDKVGDYLRDLQDLLERYQYRSALYGHFGEGCIHARISFDLESQTGIHMFRSFMNEAADLVVKYGGSLSGEHGDGHARAELLPKMYGDELVRAFHAFKAIWDPDGKMNPGKVVDAYRLDEHLRLGTSYNPAHPKTHFSFVNDQGSLARASLRCIGFGRCRRTEGGTMCPSYMVTREERHSTRGRAHLLFEMLQGDVLKEGWRSEEVKEALDLCLACKGCKSDCPVNVDMATYKAEFLSHYYERKLRPMPAYTMGLIYWWSRLASHVPTLVNAITHLPILSRLVKAMGGLAPQRSIPYFARQTFKHWFQRRGPHNVGMPQVLLWPDTFNNYFHPEVAIAAVEVLETAGYQVLVPKQSMCCGRPLYDHGFLTIARQQLQQILDTLGPQIVAGVPVVGLEPSCISVFRDELKNFFPHDEKAQRLASQSFLLSEFLEQQGVDYHASKISYRAIVHGHCHHKAIVGMKDELSLLAKLGVDFTVPDSGCCGMAGAFGFEKAHYDISVQVGERALLPAIRNADRDALIITDGFSCHEQVEQMTGRKPLHLAQVIQLALSQQKERATKVEDEG
jgi:FAD/FMN-containing dehydrogenase/Fe-S oxidoreductase